jgi:cyclopropane-fatty-acyl-phospholipid synthase
MSSYARDQLATLLARADVTLDGTRSWDISVRDPRMYRRVVFQGLLGAGESYMDGWWDCRALDEMVTRVLRANIDIGFTQPLRRAMMLLLRWRNRQRGWRAFVVGKQHYDIGDDLYRRMLDPRMIYSCAYWSRANTLDEAQEQKLELVCRKLRLERGMRVLDIGCGWGGAARFAAERYGVSVTGVTVSENQVRTAREYCRGLPIQIHFQDYRALTGQYDRIYSLGMFEHVGESNYATLFAKVHRLLVADGLFLLQTIGANTSATGTDPWIERYIFPNSHLPTLAEIGAAAERHWVIEDWHNFGVDYDRTLMSWHHDLAQRWHEIPHYDERFRRMWHYWLMTSAAAFRARRNQLWQIVMTPHGLPGGYQEVR